MSDFGRDSQDFEQGLSGRVENDAEMKRKMDIAIDIGKKALELKKKEMSKKYWVPRVLGAGIVLGFILGYIMGRFVW